MDNLRQIRKIFDIEILHRKKLLLTIISTLFFVIIYLNISTNNSHPQHPQISLDRSRPPAITIGGFYHFSTVASRWKGIVAEQMLLAHLSGLVNVTSNIYVTGLGKIENNKSISDIFSSSKFIYEYDTKTEVYEYPTLIKLEKFCAGNNRSLVWYAHSKAASHEHNEMAPWRDVMNYFILDKWHHCHGLLSTTNYTTCGAILTHDSVRVSGWNTYYAGNMWWTKCSHVNRLTRLAKIDQKDRFLAEIYVTSEPAVGHFNCFFADLRIPIPFNRETANCTINYPLWRVR